LDFVNLIILTRFKYNVTMLILEDKANKYHTIVMFIFYQSTKA
jgi:hypothetical protein